MARRRDDATEDWVCLCTEPAQVTPIGQCCRCYKPHVDSFSQRSLELGHQRRDARAQISA